MIITCPNCNKQFKTDISLIPDEGRELQCGSCDKVWFYKPDNDKKSPLTLNFFLQVGHAICMINYISDLYQNSLFLIIFTLLKD